MRKIMLVWSILLLLVLAACGDIDEKNSREVTSVNEVDAAETEAEVAEEEEEKVEEVVEKAVASDFAQRSLIISTWSSG